MKRFAAMGRTALVLALAALAVGWTVLMGMGVDGIISDDVDLMMEVARRVKPQGGLCW